MKFKKTLATLILTSAISLGMNSIEGSQKNISQEPLEKINFSYLNSESPSYFNKKYEPSSLSLACLGLGLYISGSFLKRKLKFSPKKESFTYKSQPQFTTESFFAWLCCGKSKIILNFNYAR